MSEGLSFVPEEVVKGAMLSDARKRLEGAVEPTLSPEPAAEVTVFAKSPGLTIGDARKRIEGQ